MNRTNFFCSSFFSLLVCFLLFVNQATAVPVLKHAGGKKHVETKKHARTTKLGGTKKLTVAKKHTRVKEHAVEKKHAWAKVHAVKISKKHHLSHRVAVRHAHTPLKARVVKQSTRSASQDVQINNVLSAKSVIIIDASTGNTLFARSPDSPRQPASTIKVLTGMIALKTLGYTDLVPVSFKAAQQPRSKVFLDQNREYNAGDLINAVLLASANDASVALAEKIAGSEQSFAQQMTSFAHQWGANQTTCKTATGLTAQGQETTARDLATIFRHAMENSEFAARMKQINVHTADGKLLHSHNRALWQVPGSEGGKTGYTDVARQTYVGKFRRGNDEIIVAIMGSETMWRDLKKLVEFGFQKKNTHHVAATSGPVLKVVPVAEIL
jgi:serine-type D-Ala-D-Ala carboxypeptidase (penicillin-binding protein 5/6)